MKVRFLTPEFPPIWSYLPDLIRIYRNGQFSNRGQMVQKFERDLKNYFGHTSISTPVCVDNATTGLEIALKALELPKNSKILVPSMTFAASVLAIKNADLEPVYCDVDENTLCMIPPENFDPKGFSAIMPVCAYGNHINGDIINFGTKNKLKIVIDAAGAIGTYFPGVFSDATVYSFHATKTLPVGEGGCITFFNPIVERRARRLLDFGFNSHRECELIGRNGKMSEIDAAIGIQSLKMLPNVLSKRVKIRARYQEIFKNLEEKGYLKFQSGLGLQLLTIICKDEEFKGHLEYHLNSNGIETRVYYRPCHVNGVLANFSPQVKLKNTEDLMNRIISLPLYSSLTNKELSYIDKVVKNWRLY